MSLPVTTPCPQLQILADYASGVLPESDAELLGAHLETCLQCQESLDRVASRTDSLIEAMRRPVDMKLDDFDSSAVRLPPKDGKSDTTRFLTDRTTQISAGEAIPLDSFIRSLCKSKLISSAEIDELIESIDPSDTEAFARELVARGKLTRFQSSALKRGRYKGLMLGNYVILDKLGSGGMGNIFKARHLRMGRVVCIKVLKSARRKSQEVVERFRREAQTVAALNHPNIVVAHDADEADGIPFLVMEYIDGDDLAKHVAKHGPLDVQTAFKTVLDVALALDYAHKQGIIHRDIKPHNILLASGSHDDASGVSSPTVKVLDMGLARFDSYLQSNSDATTQASMTASGIVMGTVDYISPEQALNSRNADERSDIYSLGCTLYFLLTGKVLFAGETLMEKLLAHREQPAPSLPAPRFNKMHNAVLHKMVAKNPADRYQSMVELSEDLTAVLQGRSPQAITTQRNPFHLSRRSMYSGGIVLTLLIGFILGVSFILPGMLNFEPGSVRKNENAANINPGSLVAGNEAKFEKLGHPNTLANGGRGRVLLVLPDYFYADNYTAVADALNKRSIEFETVSANSGYASPKHKEIKPVKLTTSLDKIDPQDFDAVVMAGGNTDAFRAKAPAFEPTKKMILDCLGSGKVVVGIGNACEVLQDANAFEKTSCEIKKSVHLCTRKGYGTVIKVDKTDHVGNMVSLVFDEMLR